LFNQKNKFATAAVPNAEVKPIENPSGNFNKPVASVKHTTHTSVNRSSFGAGILEPAEIAAITVKKNINTMTNTTPTNSANLSGKENFAQNNTAEINVTKNQSSSQNSFQDSLQPKPVAPDADNTETAKPEPVIKRSFFGRLQQITIFGSRNRNDNTIKNNDENSTTQNEYNNKNVVTEDQSEHDHLPHGRYLPPHAQALYKAHTQSLPPTQQNQTPNQTQNSGKETFEPLRQIASQINKLGNNSANNVDKKHTQRTDSPSRPHDPRYKKSTPNYRYNNSTSKTDGYYAGAKNNINDSPESLFDEDLQETEEFAAFRRLIGDGAAVDDEEQRRLASLLGEPKEDPPVDNGTPSSYPPPPPPNRVIRYPNNRNYRTNVNNTKSNNTRPEHTGTPNTDKRWTPPVNNQTDKSTVVRGRRGSRFVGNGQKVVDGINTDGTNRQNIPPNSGQQPPYPPRQTAAHSGQYWQTNSNNETPTTQNTRPATPTNRNIRPDQNWRGRKQPDNRNIADTQNNNIRYNNSHYQTTAQTQPQYHDYSSHISNDIGTEDADYIEEYGNGIVSEEERLSFAQAHKNIPSWEDAVESIVDANIQRHSRQYQNPKRR
jgi:hypothetical protein